MKPDIRNLIDHARNAFEHKKVLTASAIYRIILQECWPPKNGVDRVAYGEACVNFARVARSGGAYGEAVDWYLKALIADPAAVEYRAEMAITAMMPYRMLEQARTEAYRCTRIDPTYGDGWRALGATNHELGNALESIEAYDKLLELEPDNGMALLDRCTIGLDVEEYYLCRQLVGRIKPGDPKAADGQVVLGMIAHRTGKHEQCIDLMAQAIADGCNEPDMVRWNRSLSMLAIGNYKEGWQEHECRLTQKQNSTLAMPGKRFGSPKWKGEAAPASIHLHEEMGFGDTLCMMRYAPLLAERGYDVRFECRDELVDLARRSLTNVTVFPKAKDFPGVWGIKPFDYHVPMLSLPAVFGTGIDDVPWQGPYLKADPELVAKYRARLPKPGMNIGLAWSSGIRDGVWISRYGQQKSMAFDELLPILGGDVNFVSLQVGPERAEHAHRIADLLPTKPSWDDTAALVEALDLVITVDTALAHLAGALGKPLWVMMHTAGSWHWMVDRLDSPWYPTARLFRQKRAHDWRPVISAIRKELTALQQRAA